MNEIRDKFIDDLADGLENANIADNETILEDYIALYDEKLAKGLTDMEVIIALGDPSDIVKSLMKKLTNTSLDGEEAIKETLKDTVSDLIDKPTTVKEDKGKKKEKKIKETADKSKVATLVKPSVKKELLETPPEEPNIIEESIITTNEEETVLTVEEIPVTAFNEEESVAEIVKEEPVIQELEFDNSDIIIPKNVIQSDIMDIKRALNLDLEIKEEPEKDTKFKNEKEPKGKQEKKEKAPKVKKKKKFRKPKKPKNRLILKFFLFLSILITAILIPIAIVFGGLTFLLSIPVMERLIQAGASFVAAIVLYFINTALRNFTKSMIVKQKAFK